MDLRLRLLGLGGTIFVAGALAALAFAIVAAATGGAAALVLALAAAIALAIAGAVLFALADAGDPAEARRVRLERALARAAGAVDASDIP